MTSHFGAMCDDFYIGSRRILGPGLGLDAESVLHFFGRILCGGSA